MISMHLDETPYTLLSFIHDLRSFCQAAFDGSSPT